MSHCPGTLPRKPRALHPRPGPGWPPDPAPAYLEGPLPRPGLGSGCGPHPKEALASHASAPTLPRSHPASPLTKTAKRRKSR